MTRVAIDTSAIVEVLTLGPRSKTVRQAMDDAGGIIVTPVTRAEAAFVLMGRFGWTRAELDRAWQSLGAEEVAIDVSIGGLAVDAYERWGKGRAKAGLNFGDCFSYALASACDVPLLYVGDDFSQTDLRLQKA